MFLLTFYLAKNAKKLLPNKKYYSLFFLKYTVL